MDELSSFNRERWNGLARAGVLYSRPKLELDEAAAREMVDEAGLLGDVQDKRILVLAGGGGQQSAALGLLGAKVTVLDLSDEQLEKDRVAAEHYGHAPVLLQGDMRDLSRFAEDAFDIVFQPFSINFVPEVRPVFAGVAGVLKLGGLYHVQWHNPYTQTFNPDDYDPVRGYSSNSIYRDGEVDVVAIYGTDTWGVEAEDGSKIELPGPEGVSAHDANVYQRLDMPAGSRSWHSVSTRPWRKTRSRVLGSISRRSARRIWRSGPGRRGNSV